MGKQIKSSAVTLDGSSMGAAAVGPTGTVRLRPKTDSSALEVSYNGAAYVTLSGAGGGSPGSPASSLQYNNAGAFGGVTSSVVSGANITLGGDLTFSRVASYSTVLFYRENAAAADVANGDVVGGVVYQGKVSGSALALGYMGAYYESTTPLGGVLVLGARDGANARIELKDNAPTPGTKNSVTLIASGGTHFVQVQEGGIAFSTGSAASIWYKGATGFVTDLPIGAVTQVLTVTDIGMGVLQPRWATPAGGGGSGNPGGSASELQFRSTGTAFGAVSGSAVSGANVTLTGDLTFERTGATYAGGFSTIKFRREEASAAVIVSGDPVGGLTLHGRLVTVGITQLAAISSYWDNTTGGANNLGVLRLVARDGTKSRIEIYDSGATINGINLIATNGSVALSVQQGGIGLAGNAGSLTTGAVYYRDSSGFIAGLQSLAGFLKSTGTNAVPAFAALAGSDIASGVVALARGGTGSSLTDPNADRIMFWDDSAGVVDWLTAGTGLTITGTTITASGSATAAGGSTELQYRDSGTGGLGAVSGSTVSSIGDLTFTHSNAAFNLLVNRTGTSLVNGNEVGRITFTGTVGGVPDTAIGFIRGLYESANGGPTIDMGLSATSRIYIGTTAATITVGSHSIQVQTGGIAFSTGSSGAMWYKDGSGFVTAITIGSSGTFLKSNGSVPSWASLAASDIGSGTLALARGGTGSSLTDPNADRILFWDDSAGVVDWLTAGTGLTITGTTITASGGSMTVPGSATELQYRSSGTALAALAGSSVSSASVSLSGDLTFEHTGATYSGSYSTIAFRREEASSAVIVSGQPVGGLTFNGRLVSVGIVQLGAISSYWDNTTGGANNLGVLRLVARDGSQSRVEIFASGATKNGVNLIADNGSKSLSVQDGGIGLAGHAGSATTGALYYRDSGGFISGLAGAAGFLKSAGSGNVPAFTALSGSDIASGTVALARGGTGASLSDPNADRIMFWDDSAGAVDWLTVSTGLTITGTTMTASGGGTPAGSGSELQYRNAGAFGAISGTSVSGADITLGGKLTSDFVPTATGHNIRTDRRLGTTTAVGDDYSAIFWYHSGSTGSATSRKSLALAFEYSVNSPASTNGDALLEFYAQTSGSLSISSNVLHGIMMDASNIVSTISTWYGIRLKSLGSATITTKRAFYHENGAGDIVFNAGADLATSATVGHLFIPTCNGTPTGNMTGLVPTGCVVLVYDRSNNKLCVNEGSSTWLQTIALT